MDLPNEHKNRVGEFLALHVRLSSEGAGPQAFATWRGRTPKEIKVNFETKIGLEIGHWADVFLQLEGGPSALLSDHTRKCFEGMRTGSLARTLRMLRALEALLLDDRPYYKTLEGLKTQLPRLVAVLPRLNWENENATLLPTRYPEWSIPPALLLIRAVAWSQTEWEQPYLWEAYSALHARRDHDWLDRPVLDLLAYLIRYQSAPGQVVRESGDSSFLDVARELDLFRDRSLGMDDRLIEALAASHDFRNRKLATFASGPQPDDLEKKLTRTVGVYDHGPTDWLRLDSAEESPRKRTWSYTRWLVKSPKDAKILAQFQGVVERVQGSGDGRTVNYSFGRDFRQRQTILDALERVNRAPKREQKRLLDSHFHFLHIDVPHWRGQPAPEEVRVIRPRPEVSVANLVFSNCGKPEKPLPQKPRAWDVYNYLFELGQRRQHIELSDRSGDEYCPTSLITRILEVCHGYCPDDCISIPLQFNDRPLDFIYLPRLPDSPRDSDLKRMELLARYVPSFVLNLAMTHDVRSCEVGLLVLKGSGWYQHIDEQIRNNSFDLLLEKYLNDYRAEPSSVYLRKSSLDLLSPTLSSMTAQADDLDRLLKCQRKRPRLVGIDVGGSFTKIQVYELAKHGAAVGLLPLDGGEPSKILTDFPPGRSADKLSESEKLREKIENFAVKIWDEIKKRSSPEEIDAVGLTWPGPVRSGRIQGTSGILAKVGLTGSIKANDIQTVMKLDVCAAISEKGGGQPVTLVNDGDAHAWATLSSHFLRGEQQSGKGVVVKLGTGTAGALVDNGQLRPGLLEFGKIIVNLAYQVPKQGVNLFPAGVATSYCSAKALRTCGMGEIETLHQSIKLEPPLESIEVGLIAAACGMNDDRLRKHLNRLRRHSGAIELAASLKAHRSAGGLAQSTESDVVLDVAELETLEDLPQWKSRQRQADAVRRRMGITEWSEADAHQEYRRRVTKHGILRLADIFGLSGSKDKKAFLDYLDQSKALRPRVRRQILETARRFLKCVESLGSKLADLLALLFLQHKMDYAVLGGGVLSGETGQTVRRRIVEHLADYSWIQIRAAQNVPSQDLIIRFSDREEKLVSTDPESWHGKNQAPIDDHGTMGAALCGAFELLRKKELQGLRLVTECVQSMAIMDQLDVTRDKVEIRRLTPPQGGRTDERREVRFRRHGLDIEKVCAYLDRSTRVLGIVRTPTEPQKDGFTYTRWLTA